MAREFQSAPVIADGRTQINQPSGDGSYLFQSAPVIADGRTASAMIVSILVMAVSIRARHR